MESSVKMATKTKRTNKEETIPSDELVEDFDQLINQFMEDSHRASVVLGAAKLDSLLGQLLSKYLIAHYTNEDPLLNRDGPLSSFSSKIHIAYRLGLIDAEFAKALHLIRRIRNEFAHEVKDAQLNTSPHRELIRDLTFLFQHASLFDVVKRTYFSDISGPSANFFTALAILIMRLETIIIKVEPVQSDKAFGIRLS